MNRSVLIADGNSGRGQRLADACRAAQIECREAPHGAAALELALSEKPGIVVAQLELPLVGAVKLAEILRANPRTRAAHFLFLGDDPKLARQVGVGDELLPSEFSSEELIARIEACFEKQVRMDMLDEVTSRDDPVQGDLGQLPLADLLQFFYSKRRSGRLELWRRVAEQTTDGGFVVIRDGDVIQSETGLVVQEKALFRMLAWQQGRFHFQPGQSNDPVVILTPTQGLLVEGMRQLDEWERQAPQMPPMEAHVKLTLKSAELPTIVHPLTQEVLLLLDICSRVRDVVDQCSFPDYQVLRTLHTLIEREIVQLRQAPTQPRPPASSESATGLFNEIQARRLRDWLGEGRLGGGTIDAKLLVASSDPGAMPDFLNLLSQVDGVSVDPANAPGAEDLVTLGRIEVSDQLGIELLHVPLSRRFRPVWPLAGHGALGTLFLLSGPIGEAAERVSDLAAVLGALPRSRTFHVVLLRKGERISPDELKDNLSLIDEASLFLLPIESEKAPAGLLRSLFTRVMP